MTLSLTSYRTTVEPLSDEFLSSSSSAWDASFVANIHGYVGQIQMTESRSIRVALGQRWYCMCKFCLDGVRWLIFIKSKELICQMGDEHEIYRITELLLQPFDNVDQVNLFLDLLLLERVSFGSTCSRRISTAKPLLQPMQETKRSWSRWSISVAMCSLTHADRYLGLSSLVRRNAMLLLQSHLWSDEFYTTIIARWWDDTSVETCWWTLLLESSNAQQTDRSSRCKCPCVACPRWSSTLVVIQTRRKRNLIRDGFNRSSWGIAINAISTSMKAAPSNWFSSLDEITIEREFECIAEVLTTKDSLPTTWKQNKWGQTSDALRSTFQRSVR